jgi:hypothetical protein
MGRREEEEYKRAEEEYMVRNWKKRGREVEKVVRNRERDGVKKRRREEVK